jgi:hypothetical protein
MRKLVTPTLLLLTLLSPVSSAAERRGMAFTRAEICELVEAALTMPYGSELEGLAGNSCVQRNATEAEKLLVDVALVSVDGKETRPLRQGETCGRYQQYLRKKGEDVIFVGIGLTRFAPDKVWFTAGLGGIQRDARGKEHGTIGVGCGAGNEGVIERKFGRWSECRRTSR